MDRRLFIIVPGLACSLYSLWWNHFVFLKKAVMVGSIHSVQEVDQALAFHPELDTQGILASLNNGVQGAPPAVQRDIIRVLEIHTPPDKPLPFLALARSYSLLWTQSQSPVDYMKAVHYFKKTLQLKPQSPEALYGLYCLYGFHGDNREEVVGEIVRIWGAEVEKGLACETI